METLSSSIGIDVQTTRCRRVNAFTSYPKHPTETIGKVDPSVSQTLQLCSRQPTSPLRDDACHLDEDILRALAGPLESAEAVIGGIEGMECGAFAELLTHGLEKVLIRQLIARAVQEEHWDGDRAK